MRAEVEWRCEAGCGGGREEGVWVGGGEGLEAAWGDVGVGEEVARAGCCGGVAGHGAVGVACPGGGLAWGERVAADDGGA